MLKRVGMFAATGMLALMVLAACGSGDDDEAEPTVTRMAAENAPEVTPTPAEEEEEEGAETPAASSPAAGSPEASPAASPVAESATPVAEATESVTGAATPSVSTPIASPPISATTPPVAQELEVDMVDIAFSPKEITIPANTDVVIKLPNKGVTTHNFHVDALGVESGDVAAGAETTVTINAAPGEYEYYCSIPGHKQAGMVGKLIVQ